MLNLKDTLYPVKMYDIIVIGAGLGGLTAGAKLAKEGKKVLLLEQHDRPGGCASTFKRKDFTMEVGLHEMDGLHPRDLKKRIFGDLDILNKVDFLEVPEFYRFVNGRQDIVIPLDPEQAQKVLCDRFPGEEPGIKEYFHHLLNSRKIISESAGKPEPSLGEFLDHIISTDDLKLVLLGNLGYFHDDPYTLSLYYYLTAQGSYYCGTASFIRGGSQKLSDALASVITEHNGVVKLNSLVTAILCDRDKAVGVSIQNTKGKNAGIENIYASDIIVNVAVPNLASELLPPEQGKRLSEQIKEMKIGASLLTVYYGFRQPLKDTGNRYYSTFIFDPSVRKQSDIIKNNHGDIGTRSFTFVDYSQLDSYMAPPGKSVGAACCIDYTSGWEGLDRKEYLRRKEDVAVKITGRLDKLIPGFSDAVEYFEVATSLTVKRYTLNPEGAVYGFAQNPRKPSVYLSSLPDNMYIASAWGKFGGGFSGSVYSGYMTALDILRKK